VNDFYQFLIEHVRDPWQPPGLLDGICLNQKSQFGYSLAGLAIEDVGLFYGHLAYFTAIWYILWQFGILHGHVVNISPSWYVAPRINLPTPATTVPMYDLML
jgi:hypothetical protein